MALGSDPFHPALPTGAPDIDEAAEHVEVVDGAVTADPVPQGPQRAARVFAAHAQAAHVYSCLGICPQSQACSGCGQQCPVRRYWQSTLVVMIQLQDTWCPSIVSR
jgi:hypothetical protein